MSQHSEHGGYIRFSAAALYSDEALDTACVRDCVVNNLAHAYDMATQVRINYVAVTSSGYLIPSGTISAGLWYPVCSFVVPMTIMEDGTPAKLVVRVAGAAYSGTQTSTWSIHWRGFTLPTWGRDLMPAPPASSAQNAYQSSVATTTTHAWLGSKVLTFPQEQLASCAQMFDAYRSGAAIGAATTYLSRVDVWNQSDKGSEYGYLSGLYAREFVG